MTHYQEIYMQEAFDVRLSFLNPLFTFISDFLFSGPDIIFKN